MEFKIDGKAVLPTAGYNPKIIKKHLDGLKDGELLSPAIIAEKLNLATGYLRDTIKLNLPDYAIWVKNKIYFGNAKSVKAYKDQQGVNKWNSK